MDKLSAEFLQTTLSCELGRGEFQDFHLKLVALISNNGEFSSKWTKR